MSVLRETYYESMLLQLKTGPFYVTQYLTNQSKEIKFIVYCFNETIITGEVVLSLELNNFEQP